MTEKQDIADLQQQMADMRAELDSYRNKGLRDLVTGTGQQRFGGGSGQLDRFGVQVKVGTASGTAVYLVGDYPPSPPTFDGPIGEIGGRIGTAFSSIDIEAIASRTGPKRAYLQLFRDAADDQGFVGVMSGALLLSGTTSDPTNTNLFLDNYGPGFITYRSDTTKFRVYDGAWKSIATETYVDAHTTDAADAHDASAISILDTAGDFTATDVEGALAELTISSRAAGLDARDYGTLTASSEAAAATNTATIEAAIAAAAASVIKTVLLPGGIYYVDDVTMDQAVKLRGHGAELTTLAYTSRTGYAVTMNHGYAEMENLRIYYDGTTGTAASQTAGGHIFWKAGRRLDNLAFETNGTTYKAWRYINHFGINPTGSANWRWHGCTFGGAASAVADCGLHLDQDITGATPPGDSLITDCQFLDSIRTVPAIRIKGVPSMRLLNPKFLGWSIGVLIDWSPTSASSNGFYWVGGSCEEFTTTGLKVARSSGAYTIVDSLISGVEFVPNSGSANIPCIDITDGSAPGWNITGSMFMQNTAAGQIGVRLGSGSDNVSIVGNFFKGLASGVTVHGSATDTYIGPNFFISCTADVTDASSVVSPVDIYNDAKVKGYFRAGSLTAPTNVTDGDVTSTRLYVGTDAAFTTANTPIADIRGGGRFGAAGNDVLIGKAMATASTPGVSLDYNVATAAHASLTALNPGVTWIPLVLAAKSIELSPEAQDTAFFVVDANGVKVRPATATPANGSTSARLLFGTTAGFGIYYGSGAPTVTAAQGSIYIRSDGSSTSTRLYVNTDGGTTWTNFTSAA